MSAPSAAAQTARDMIEASRYLVLATADATGRPWSSPVYFAHIGFTEFYWVSSPEVTHSRNIAVRPEVIGLYRPGSAPGDLDCRAEVQILNRIYLGDHSEFSVRAEGLGDLLVRLPKAVETTGLEPGAAAVIGWRGSQALALNDS